MDGRKEEDEWMCRREMEEDGWMKCKKDGWKRERKFIILDGRI